MPDERPGPPDALVADLKDALDQLGAELDRQRNACGELETTRAALQDLQAREAELVAELEARDRRLSDQEALQNELARRLEEAECQRARLAELERTVARVSSERDDAERRGREQCDRADAECVALAREILQLEERITALQAEQSSGDSHRDRALTAARQALSALQHTHAETVADRDELAGRTSTLEQRLEEARSAYAQVDNELRAGRERWAAERAELEAHARHERNTLRKRANARLAALRRQVRTLDEALNAQRASRLRTAAMLKRTRARWKARLHEVHARWNAERQALLDGAERALAEQVETLQAECQDLRRELQAARRDGNALAAARRELESVRRMLEETRCERDAALRLAETRDGEEGALAELRVELTQLHEAQRSRDTKYEQTVRSLERERDEAAHARDEAQSRLGGREREVAALHERLAASASSHDQARAEDSTERERLHALVIETTAERDALRSQLESSDQERNTLNESLHATQAALERGRAGALREVQRLHGVVASLTRERDYARRQIEARRDTGAAPSETTAKATAWLDAVLTQMAGAAPDAIQGQQVLAERLRMVRAALAESVARPTATEEEPPRPRSEDFPNMSAYRAAVASWLNQARARRDDKIVEMERLTAEVQSADEELALFDRDLALGRWNDEGTDASDFDGIAALAEAHLDQEP